MSKFLVETYYTCTFKIMHELSELNEKQIKKAVSTFIVPFTSRIIQENIKVIQ